LAIAVEPPESPDARWCLERYFLELAERFDAGFDPANGNMLTGEEMTPPAGWLLVARLEGAPVGCGALKRLDKTAGEIKRVWTAPSVRGLGVASRLMDRLEALAAEQGFRAVRLDTNKTLTEARRLYLKRGYGEVPRYNDNPYAHYWFEKQLP
jgi:GNAT superfamily N-acetyltransferase